MRIGDSNTVSLSKTPLFINSRPRWARIAGEVPVFQGETTEVEKAAIRDAKSMNRRITIEDKVVNVFNEADQ